MKLNLGCGTDIREGYVNVDRKAAPGVDLVEDLDKYPWTFKDSSVDMVVMSHVLEHLSNTSAALGELKRICKSGAIIEVTVPYWNSEDAVTDPTHVRFFNRYSVLFGCQAYGHWVDEKSKRYCVKLGSRYFWMPARTNETLETLAFYVSNVIQVMRVELCVR